MIAFIIVPKNSGLKQYRDVAISELGLAGNEKLEVRGEDVPLWLESVIKTGKKAIGITGQDLYKEYCLKNYRTDTKILKIISWNDERAIYGKPVLCLLGPANRIPIPRKAKICISSKYKFLARKYLNLLEQQGYSFEKFYVAGSTESSYAIGLADLVIDIVYSGKSINEIGLSVYDKIFSSDIVVIGGKDD
ncbi:MAG: hypothetical protein HGA85_00395 [Nanoarchaeota archaeon]|nr:hypothetical protein [Nanoarchaeota archaeon]